MPKITPNLWFDGQAEEAAAFYTSLFPDSRIDKVVRAAADNPSTKEGDVLTVEFTLAGSPVRRPQRRARLPVQRGRLLQHRVRDQAEVDRYWDALIQGGGEHSVCGWLKDRFGLSWQVVPRQLNEMLESPDREAARGRWRRCSR